MRLRRGETPEKIEAWRRAAGEGDVEAMLILAAIAGRTPETAAESEHWWQAALDLGHPHAYHRFGVLNVRRGDLAAAERLFRRGAEGGDLENLYGLYAVHEARGDHEAARDVERTILRQEELQRQREQQEG